MSARHDEQRFQSQPDERLVERTLAGDGESFAELVRRHMTSLQHYLEQHNTEADAEDLVQETFLRAYRRLDRYRDTWRFSTWLFTIARRLSMNHQRGRRAAASTAVSADLPAEGEDPTRRIVQEEQRDNLWRTAKRVLSEPQWTALWLYYVEDMPVKEIARVQRRTSFSVKTLLFRARKRLLKHLPDGAFGPPSQAAYCVATASGGAQLTACVDAAGRAAPSGTWQEPIDAEIIDDQKIQKETR